MANTKGKLPHHLRIQHELRKRIVAGSFAKRLPAEQRLAEEFGVSYMTMRRAIEGLVNCGMVLRERGGGTYVSDRGRRKPSTRTIIASLHRGVPMGLSNPYYSEVLNGIERELHERHFSLAVSVGLDEEIEKFHHTGKFLPIQADGLILPVAEHISEELRLMNRFYPIVFLGEWQNQVEFPYVAINTAHGMFCLTKYLISLGHRRIGVAIFASGMDYEKRKGRLKGHCDALARAGLGADEKLICGVGDTFEGGLQAAEYFLSLSEPPSAIIGHNDITAIGIQKFLLDKGIRIPEQISVAGFDDIPEASRVHPGLTTVKSRAQDIGVEAVRLLFSLLEDETEPDSIPFHELSTELVIRGSTASPKHIRATPHREGDSL